VLEDGRLTDSQGRIVNFKNSVIIMTSNIGTSTTMGDKELGFRATKDEGDEKVKYERMKKKILDEVKKIFKPEFINRLDEVIVFQHLSESEIRDIVDLMMSRVKHEISSQSRSMEYSVETKELLAKEGFDPVYGARPLRRAIQRLVEDPLAEEFIRGNFKEGDHVMIDISPDDPTKLVFFREGEKPKASPKPPGEKAGTGEKPPEEKKEE
jgi:ATP-dependent Clp protease ATP-binding subunit ClpC